MNNIIISHLTLRKAIGILAIAFPFLLIIGGMFGGNSLLSSLSAYYWSNASVLFTGMLITFGVFLLSYKGYDKQDNIIYTCVLDIIADEFSSMFGTKINATTIEAQANYGVCPYTVISRSVINNYFYNKHAALSVGFINNFHVEGIK